VTRAEADELAHFLSTVLFWPKKSVVHVGGHVIAIKPSTKAKA
jgi:hypothetical protein